MNVLTAGRLKDKFLPRRRIAKLLENNKFNLILIFIIAFSLRLPLYHTVYWRTNDAIEYINLARNIASGQGFTQSFKFRYFDDYPVVTSAFHGRTSFLSVILAGIILLGGNEYTMQLFILVLGAVNACLVYVLARKWVSPIWSLIGGLLAATQPNVLINSRLVLSEPLFSTFILLSLIVIFYLREGLLKYSIAGIFTALAYLTRTEGAFLLPLLAVTAVNAPKRLTKTVVLIASFIIVSLPFFYGNYLVNGNPFFSEHSQLYTVRDLREAVEGNGYGRVFPTPLAFVRNNFFWILQREWSLFTSFVYAFLHFDFFSPLLFFLLLAYLKQSWKKFKVFYVYALIIFLVYTSAWSAQFELSRHFTTVYLLLFVPIAFALQKLSKPLIIWIILASVFLPYVTYDAHRIVWARTVDPSIDVWSQPAKEPVYTWIKSNTNKNDIISSTNPDMVYLHTNRPSIQTPSNLNKATYAQYVDHYHVKYFLVEPTRSNAFLDQVAIVKAQFSDSKIYSVH